MTKGQREKTERLRTSRRHDVKLIRIITAIHPETHAMGVILLLFRHLGDKLGIKHTVKRNSDIARPTRLRTITKLYG